MYTMVNLYTQIDGVDTKTPHFLECIFYGNEFWILLLKTMQILTWNVASM